MQKQRGLLPRSVFSRIRKIFLGPARDLHDQYIEFSRRLGIPARSICRIGTEVVDAVSELCIEAAKNYSHCVFFGGELVFEKPQWYHRILHNETAYAIQRQIRFTGFPIVILPIRIRKK